MNKILDVLIRTRTEENEKLELKTINYPNDLPIYLGEDFKRKTGKANNTLFFIYSEDKPYGNKVIIQTDYKEEIDNMSLWDAYDLMYESGWRLLPITDLRELDEEELEELEEGGCFLDTESVSWEATVTKYAHEDELYTIQTELSFFGRGEFDEQKIGAAAVTILNGYEYPYDLLRQADYISGSLVYALNGVPTYMDVFDLETKIERGRKPGVFGKVGIVTDWFIAGPYLDEKKVRKPIIQSMIEYFSEAQKIDFLVVHPNLTGILDNGYKEKTEEENIKDVTDLGTFLQDELGFLGSGDIGDAFYYSIDLNFDKCEPVDLKLKEEYIKTMKHHIFKGDLDRAVEIIEKGHNLGVQECTFELAMMHCIGVLGESNKEQAYEYFYELAQDGFPPAMFELARLLFEGKGTQENPLMGMMWLERAAKKGEKQAVELLDKLQENQAKKAQESDELFKQLLSDKE